jgi:hypothetical protein
VLRIGVQGVQTSNLAQKTVGHFGGHGVPKASQQLREPKEIPCDGNSRDLPGDGACGDSIVSRFASRHRAAVLSDFIINENLKLLQINYLA